MSWSGDQYVGRLRACLPYDSVDFAVIVPHFNCDVSTEIAIVFPNAPPSMRRVLAVLSVEPADRCAGRLVCLECRCASPASCTIVSGCWRFFRQRTSCASRLCLPLPPCSTTWHQRLCPNKIHAPRPAWEKRAHCTCR